MLWVEVGSVLLSSLFLVPQFTLGQGGGSLFEQPRIQREMREPTLILGSHLSPAVPHGPASLTVEPSHPALPSRPRLILSADGQPELPGLFLSSRHPLFALYLLSCLPASTASLF